MSFKSELLAALGIQPKPGEQGWPLVNRLLDKALQLNNVAWDGLLTEYQVWINEGLTVREHNRINKKSVQPPPILPDGDSFTLAPVPAAEDEVASEGNSNSKETPVAQKKTSADKPAKTVKAKAAPAAKPAKAAKASKAAKPAKAAKTGGASGRQPLWPPTAKIKLLKANPHRAGTTLAIQFDKLRDGMTVADALAAGVERQNLRWFVQEIGSISVA